MRSAGLRVLAYVAIFGAAAVAAGGADVRIGYFGPSDPNHPSAGGMWQAACMAMEAANRREGVAFRLVPAWAENPWSTGANRVAQMVFDDGVCAIVGGIDGATTHLAEQVAAKGRVALVSPASTDTSVNLAFVPWAFTLLPGDDVQARALVAEIDRHMGAARDLAVLSADDHDSHFFAAEALKAVDHLRRGPRRHYEFPRREPDFAAIAASVNAGGCGHIVLVADAIQSAECLRALRAAGYTGMVYGGPSMAQALFRRKAGVAAEGVIFPLPITLSPQLEQFNKDFAARSGQEADYLAAQTFDAVSLLTTAIRKSGPDRTSIYETLTKMGRWEGICGIVDFDERGRNRRPVHLASIRSGKIVLLSASAPTGGPSPR